MSEGSHRACLRVCEYLETLVNISIMETHLQKQGPSYKAGMQYSTDLLEGLNKSRAKDKTKQHI